MMDRKRTHTEWADTNIDRYERCKNRLLNRDYRPGEAPMLLLQCYRNLYGAEINYLDANIPICRSSADILTQTFPALSSGSLGIESASGSG